jgi:hypothetical protein
MHWCILKLLATVRLPGEGVQSFDNNPNRLFGYAKASGNSHQRQQGIAASNNVDFFCWCLGINVWGV